LSIEELHPRQLVKILPTQIIVKHPGLEKNGKHLEEEFTNSQPNQLAD
jgi:hypothetical protein